METIFWDKEKIQKDATSAPLRIMLEQANSLSDVTNDILAGQVLTTAKENVITYCFTIIAPYINQSRLALFCIDQPLDKEYPLEFYSDYTEDASPCVCENIDAFNTCLKKILSSQKTNDILNGLIAKSTVLK